VNTSGCEHKRHGALGTNINSRGRGYASYRHLLNLIFSTGIKSNMAEESKEIDPKFEEELVKEVTNTTDIASTSENDNDEVEDEHEDATTTDGAAAESSSKKRKSKRAKLKKVLGAGSSEAEKSEGPSASANTASKLTTNMVEQLLEMNPSLKSEVAGMGKEQAAQAVKKLDVADLLTGMVN
jgi:glycylpeptide N-tetradecanoyltransferase